MSPKFEQSMEHRKAIQQDLQDEGYEISGRQLKEQENSRKDERDFKKTAEYVEPLDGEELDAIIDSCHNLEYGDQPKIKEMLKKYLPFHTQIFKRWLEKYPYECLHQLSDFQHLDASVQPLIARFLKTDPTLLSTSDSWLFVHMLQASEDPIRDKDLYAAIINHPRISFSQLAQYADKLPYLDKRDLFERAWRRDHDSRKDWFNWAEVIPFLKLFPWVSKVQAIKNCFEQWQNNYCAIIIKHRKELGLSEEKMVELFFKYKPG